MCLLNGEQVNVRDADGFAAIHYAARFNHFEVVQLLVNGGARKFTDYAGVVL